MQIVYIGDNFHKCQILFPEKKKKNSICHLLKILPRLLSIFKDLQKVAERLSYGI